jgi:hypothetical protein
MSGPCELARSVPVPGQSTRVPSIGVAVSLSRFTRNPSPLVSGVPWWDTSGALARPCAAADAVDRRRLSKRSGPARLILFRYAARRPHSAIPADEHLGRVEEKQQ